MSAIQVGMRVARSRCWGLGRQLGLASQSMRKLGLRIGISFEMHCIAARCLHPAAAE
jgi:hypothetical protein